MNITHQKYRELFALFSANALSMIGNSLSAIAIPWFVYEITGSATATAGVVLAGQLPNLLIGLLGGHFIDRYSAKSVSLFSDAVNFFAVLSIPILFSVDGLNLLLLSGLVFLSQVLDAPGSTARRVIVSKMIDEHRLPRERVNGLDSLIETGADLLGPVFAGLLITILGAVYLLVLDAFTFLFSLLLVAFGVRQTKNKALDRATVPLWKSLKWAGNQPVIVKLGVYDLIVNSVATPLLALTLPVVAKNAGDESLWLGLWLACFAAGTTLTTVLYTLLGSRLSSLTLLKMTPIGQSLGLAILLATLSLQLPLWMVSAGLFLYGLNLGVGSMLDAMILQTKVPDERRGAVFSLFASFRYVGVPFGLLFAGVLLDRNLDVWLLTIMALILFVPAALWFNTTNEDLKNTEKS
jgi:MFS family permease